MGMLCLDRMIGQKIRLGKDIIVTVIEVKGKRVRLGFQAPKDVTIMRMEIEDKFCDVCKDPIGKENAGQSTPEGVICRHCLAKTRRGY